MKLGVNQFCWPMSWSVEEVLRSAAKLGYERMEICFTAADGAAPGGGVTVALDISGYHNPLLNMHSTEAEIRTLGHMAEDCGISIGSVGGIVSFSIYPLTAEDEATAEKSEYALKKMLDGARILGASTIDALVARERYGAVLGCEPACSTDDGTYGRAGFCTPLVEEALAAAAAEGAPYDYVACCGPEPLMKIVAGMADAAGVFCEVSMERRMACGVGACLSCVVDTVDGKRRACVDGPVFPASEVVW